jgi:hypothetical protein
MAKCEALDHPGRRRRTQRVVDLVALMRRESRRLAGIILILVPAVAFGGASLLTMILGGTPEYFDNEVRQAVWRAGHAHAGVLLILALVALQYVDETSLRGRWLWLARHGIPIAAILMPAGFFLSILDPAATAPNVFIGFVYLGGLFLVGGVASLGIGLLRGDGSRGIDEAR